MLSTYLLPRFEGSPVLGFGGHICREPRFGCNPVSGFGERTYSEPGFGATWSQGSGGIFTGNRGLGQPGLWVRGAYSQGTGVWGNLVSDNYRRKSVLRIRGLEGLIHRGTGFEGDPAPSAHAAA